MQVYIILIAATLIVLLRLAGKYIYLLPISKASKKIISRGFPVIEFLSWLFFAGLVIISFIKQQSYREAVMLIVFIVIILTVSWFFLRDFVAGIFIRTDSSLEINARIKVNDIEGYISKIGYLNIEIMTGNGEQHKIPYSIMQGSVIAYPGNEDNRYFKHSIVVECSKNKAYTTYLERWYVELLNSPLVLVSVNPVVSLVETTEASFFFKLEFYTISKVHAQKTEVYLRNRSNIISEADKQI